MKSQEKIRLISKIITVGLISITIVILSSYAAELRYDNNKLINANNALQGEVDTLNVEIKQSSHINYIEKIAKTKLGMVQPAHDDCVYVSENDKPEGNFAMLIKKNVYN